jgi:superoxide dismutase, Fe-Mn family
MDYGAKAAAYVDGFMQNIAWDKVSARFASCVRTGA